MSAPLRVLPSVAALAGLLLIAGLPAHAGEIDALAILANLRARHLPYGAVLDPIFPSSTSDQIVGYTRCGDSATWTGHYLAAEAFRYKVTQAPDALQNVKLAIAAIKGLVDVTQINLLARCMVPADSQYAAGISSEEAHNGIYTKSVGWVWVGNTSRDQYSGVMFGLAVAYDMVDDPAVKSGISDLVTRLVRYLTGHNWSVEMPNGTASTSFLIRPEQMLSFVQVGRKVNSKQFSDYYDQLQILLFPSLLAPTALDVLSDDSYFKFNLDYINLYNLLRLEGPGFARDAYQKAYSLLRNHTAGHQNAFFNVIDRGLQGANAARDAETAALLDQWLQRPRRDNFVDLGPSVPVCGGQACLPIPVPLRVPTDFLWQRSPFQLAGGGSGGVENAGIDYILPYWMARFYGVIGSFSVRSAAAPGPPVVAPESLASLFGSRLANATAQAQPPALSLGGVGVKVLDSAGVERDALLLYVSPSQVNLLIPKGTAVGLATFTLSNAGAVMRAAATVQSTSPALFSANGSGSGVAAATAIRVQAANPQLRGNIPVFQCSPVGCTSIPIDVGVDAPVYLTLYGTGIRSWHASVAVSVHGIGVPVLFAGAQPEFSGLDQVNILLPLNLRGSGESIVVLTVDGQAANPVTINIQ